MNSDRLVTVPKRVRDLTVRDIWDFIRIVESEFTQGGYPQDEIDKLNSFTHGFGNISTHQAYYRQAYCQPLLRAMKSMFERWPNPRVVDIGCGTGGQAILFASSGASVVALDLDELQIKTAKSRIAFFEPRTGKLDIRFDSADVTKCDYASYGQFEVAYSHGCIARYVRAQDIFERLRPALSPGGLVIMKTQNPDCWLLRMTRGQLDLSSARDFIEGAKASGFRPLLVSGPTGTPRPLWFAGEATHLVDFFLRRFRVLQIHLEIIFEKMD